MPYGDNPAQRLFELLSDARRYANNSAVDGWAAVFGADATDISALARRGGDVVDLARETRRLVEALPDDDPELVLRSFPGVEQTVIKFWGVAAHQTMAHFLQPYDDLAAYSLESAASLLHRRRREVVVLDSDLDKLIAMTRGLIDAVVATDGLDSATTAWMVELLRQLEHALLNVEVTGSAEIDNAANRIVGGLIRQPSRTARFVGLPVWKAVMGLLLAVNTALGADIEYQQITSTQQQQIIVQILNPDGPVALPPSSQTP